MRCQFSTAADQRMMCAVVMRPLSIVCARVPGASSFHRAIALSPDQRLTVHEQALARFGGERRLDRHEQHGARLALLELDVGVARVRDRLLADREAAEELDLV